MLGFATGAQASTHILNADPNYSFGTVKASASAMKTAVSLRLGRTITQVSTLPLENVDYAPNLAAPPYIHGASANGYIRNLNLGSVTVSGIVNGKIRSAGTSVVGGVTFNKFVLRVFTATHFHDILIEVNSFSGTPASYGAAWSFTKIGSGRPISLLP